MCKNSKRDMCKETEGVVASVSKRLSTEGLVGKTERSVVKCNSLDGGSQGGCYDRDSSTMGAPKWLSITSSSTRYAQ